MFNGLQEQHQMLDIEDQDPHAVRLSRNGNGRSVAVETTQPGTRFEELRNTQLTLISNDGILFNVDRKAAFQSEVLKHMASSLGPTADFEVDISVANGVVLKKVIDYFNENKNKKYEAKAPDGAQRIRLTEDQEKFLNVDEETLQQLLEVADFLHIPELIDIVCQKIADMMRGKTSDEIRSMFLELPDDLTNEEKREIAEKYKWTKEGDQEGFLAWMFGNMCCASTSGVWTVTE